MTKEISPGYILVPINRPLPAEAKTLDRRRRRRIDRLLDPFRPKSTPLQPIPGWGKPITNRIVALALIGAWLSDTCGLKGDPFEEEMLRWARTLPDTSRRG